LTFADWVFHAFTVGAGAGVNDAASLKMKVRKQACFARARPARPSRRFTPRFGRNFAPYLLQGREAREETRPARARAAPSSRAGALEIFIGTRCFKGTISELLKTRSMSVGLLLEFTERNFNSAKLGIGSPGSAMNYSVMNVR